MRRCAGPDGGVSCRPRLAGVSDLPNWPQSLPVWGASHTAAVPSPPAASMLRRLAEPEEQRALAEAARHPGAAARHLATHQDLGGGAPFPAQDRGQSTRVLSLTATSGLAAKRLEVHNLTPDSRKARVSDLMRSGKV